MKHPFTFSLFVLFSCTNAAAQRQVAWSPVIMKSAVWNEPASPLIPFQFDASLNVSIRRDRIAGVWHEHLVAAAYWLPDRSFMADSVAERYRPLAQLYFDCYELESRRLQVNVNLDGAYHHKIRASEELVRNQIASLRLATNDGRDSLQMVYWRKWMDDELAREHREYIPAYRRGIFQLGNDFGTAAVFYRGALANYFDPNYTWGIGGSIRFKRIAIEVRGIYCSPVPRQPFTASETFYFTDSNRVKLTHGLWSVGYQVVNTERWSVIPYGGLSTFRLINRDQLPGSVNRNVYWAGWEAGLLAEWRFGLFHHSNWDRTFLKAMVRAGYASTHFMGKIDGNTLRLQVGIGWTLQNIRNVRPEPD